MTNPSRPSLKRVYGPADPWPFRFMEVGDKVVCLRPKATSTAHAYGASTKKRFKTESRDVDQPDGTRVRAVKVIRLPDPEGAEPLSPLRAARRAPKPWMQLKPGETWTSPKFTSDAHGDYPHAFLRLRARVYADNVRLAGAIRARLAEESAAAVAEFNKTARKPIKARIISSAERYPITTFTQVVTAVVGGYVLSVLRHEPDTSGHLDQVRRILETHRINAIHEEWDE